MKNLWHFLRDPKNLAVLVALAGGIGFVWDKFASKDSEPAASQPLNSQNQTANVQNGPGVNASGNAQVIINNGVSK